MRTRIDKFQTIVEELGKCQELTYYSSIFTPRLLSAELIVYDKHAQCLLTDGEYELILAEVDPERIKMEQKLKNSTWENITIDQNDMAVYQQFNVFGNSPTLKFRLHWSPEPAMGMVER